MELTSVINSHTKKPYTPEMADMVCKYYGFIVKNNFNTLNEPMGGEETNYHDPKMTHREASVRRACFAYDGLGFKESFVDAFVKEFDNIALLYENQPTYSIELHFSTLDLKGDLHQWTETDTKKTWGTFNKYSAYEKYKELIKLVRIEAKKLIEHATHAEINKLSYLQLNGGLTDSCIYGLMTGSCYSKRANELILSCASRVYNTDADGISHRHITNLNGKPTPVSERSKEYHSPIELFIVFNEKFGMEKNNEHLIKYLKGEIKVFRPFNIDKRYNQ